MDIMMQHIQNLVNVAGSSTTTNADLPEGIVLPLECLDDLQALEMYLGANNERILQMVSD